MPATLDLRKAHATRQHGDLLAIFTWINDERAMVLVPAYRPGAPWYVVAESASFRYDDPKYVALQCVKACEVLIVEDGPLRGAIFNPSDRALADAVGRSGSMIVDKLMMRVHIAVFTETRLLGLGPSPYRHNRFSLTRIWCYRRSRDRLPYGAIRRVRDIQQDINKRASKALLNMNSNQILAEEGATEDRQLQRDAALAALAEQQGNEVEADHLRE